MLISLCKKHLCYSGHDTNFVALVAGQGHLGVVAELGETSVFGGSPVEDGKQNAQYVFLAVFVCDREGL